MSGRSRPGVYDPPGSVAYLQSRSRLGSYLISSGLGSAREGGVFVELGGDWTAIHEVVKVHKVLRWEVLTLRRLRLLTAEEHARVRAQAHSLSPAPSLQPAPTWLVLIVLELVT